jgi:hypothetical protein
VKRFVLLAVAAGLFSFLSARLLSRASSMPSSKGGGSDPGDRITSFEAGGKAASSAPRDVHSWPRPTGPAEGPFRNGVGVCDGFSGADVHPALMSETPYHDRGTWAEFLTRNGAGFDALRKALLPVVIDRTGAARRCFEASGAEETAVAVLAVTLDAEGDSGAVSSVQVRQLQGEPGAVDAARKCLAQELEDRLPIRATNSGPLRWPSYRGTYPRMLTLYFGRGIELYSGARSE